MRRVTVAGISGSGKTTFARALAERLGVPWVELDALHHGADWTEAPAEVFRERLRATLASAPAGWVCDGNYRGKSDDIVLAAADTLVWLELPLRVSLWRLARRTSARFVRREELWHGNRERLRNMWPLFSWAVRSYVRHRRELPEAAARYPSVRFVRLHSRREVADFLRDAS